MSTDFRVLFELDAKNYNAGGTSFSRPSARGIIIQDGIIAMVHSLRHNYYKFPGGGIEQGEKREDALIREVLEEVGLVVVPQSIRKFGMVHRIQKGNYEDMFIQDNFYFLCDIEAVAGAQKLDKYEEDAGFTLEFITPEKAIETNKRHFNTESDNTMLRRETRVLEILVEEGYFNKANA